MSKKYMEYFNVDEGYFPQINDFSIEAAGPDFWRRTYPHQTFIDMLNSMERVLARQEKRSLWIEGAYGTGKSQCAYALKRILEVPEKDLRSYWDSYEPLKKKTDLLEKLIGHKQKGILTAHRYASGGIDSPRALFLAVQDSIKSALVEKNLYVGENTLKESVIAWIEKPAQKNFLNDCLQYPEWSALFSQSTADEVLKALHKDGEVKKLMDNLFRLADKEGITALNIDANRLLKWIGDIIDKNDIKIVFIWDEFSDYFKNNRRSLSEFQKLVEFVNLKPFYFIVVTHESGQLITTADTTWKKVRDRFITVQITLPDNIALELIGHAFNVKKAAEDDWKKWADDFNNQVNKSRIEVMKVTKITDEQVMKDIMPLHPMAALLLKNIASVFKSNQRSMFEFMKSTNTDDVKAFQWFIENTGPLDEHPLLTVDMLWNFFYEKGKNNLTPNIRLILDTFPQQQNLRDDEKAVLKAILIMQAIDQRLGGTIDLFKVTEQNLSYVFDGISSGLDVSCRNIAQQLVNKGILVAHPISNGRHVFSAAVLAGDQAKIDDYKKVINKKVTTSKLVIDGELSTVLSLSPALRLRFELEPNMGITPVTNEDFTRKINKLCDKYSEVDFYAVIAFTKNDSETTKLRNNIKNAVANKKYKNIVFIDALSTPLGIESFEQYVDYSAMAMYYHGNDNFHSRENAENAINILKQDWKNRIYNGQFVVYTYTKQEGEKISNGQDVASVLQTIVKARFPFAFDFTKRLTENQLKLTSGKASAKSGISQNTSGVMVGAEKYVLPRVWNEEKYWEDTSKETLPISKIKIKVEELIEDSFKREGQVSIGEIYDYLVENYGFAPCNLSAFLTGFLLKEYGGEPFRYCDSSGGNEPMTQDKLSEMIGNYIGKRPKQTYIVKMTPQERSFYELTEKSWDIVPNSCSSAGQAASAVESKMRKFGLPVWCLAEIDKFGVYEIVQKYIDLIQKEKGNEAHKKAVEIGTIAINKTNLSKNLTTLLTKENCQKGMYEFLSFFEDGKILALADEIGIKGNVLGNIRTLFEVKYSCLWDRKTGEDEIRKLLTNYGIIKQSNFLLNTTAHSCDEVFEGWQEQLKFFRVNYAALQGKFPSLTKTIDLFLKIYQQSELSHDQRREFLLELTENSVEIRNLMNEEKQIFSDIYSPYQEGFGEYDIIEIKKRLPLGMFVLKENDCNARVKGAAEEYRKNQLKTQLKKLWRDKTGTKNPLEWSILYRTPILCCVSEKEFTTAKKTFETLNQSWAKDKEIKEAIAFLEKTCLFEVLNDKNKRNALFEHNIVGEYSSLLTNLDKVREALERSGVTPYEWNGNPSVKNRIRKLAEAEYNAGGSNKAFIKIDKMDNNQLKQYIKRLIMENIIVGIEIITNGND